ncbi:hypothetical protein VC83_05390 [Pseudogymnoascus destructans]|uniref:BTB domain-containing protein n=2 Tax=Pseudogymnoascus destructans TaxID=655981 RepID=L8G904_PSED2|nr:uncharacterized protein VC83_05390 [Pseudogymnoascus destructans]ELR09098.1 hypothetical protein GMDG_03682 [Pseudogymnoascus destructans 20631-21]OAF58095.2 hypothetical protein VC83_05390 [Pseudogymnoascus destructans]
MPKKMALKPAVTPLTQDEFRKKCDSQVVTIYAGRDCQSPFTLPKDLICYYSRIFAHYFNGTSAQALSGFLNLPAVDPKLFAVLIDYVKHGSATFPYSLAGVWGREGDGAVAAAYQVISDCVRALTAFLHLCAAYDVHEAGVAIYEPLTMCVCLAQSYGIGIKRILTDGFIDIVLETLPDLPGGNPVLVLLAEARISDTVINRHLLSTRE